MIITKTPYRISFFGGGTDYHGWYQKYGGAVLSTSIDSYSYIDVRCLPPFFDYKHRIVWREVEEVNKISQIKHPAVRGCLDYLNLQTGVEMHHHGSLPARSGLGSSSTFTVGLLNALYALLGEMSSKQNLACEAVHVERDILKENVGVQDQIAAAYGGFNKITIREDGSFSVDPIIISPARQRELESHLLLFFTGVSRNATDIAADQIKSIEKKKHDLFEMRKMVDQSMEILSSNCDIKDFGKLLHESWCLKRGLSKSISNNFIDDTYNNALQAGAIGGKILGAGGGGFMLFFVEPEKQQKVIDALNDLLLVPFKFEKDGSKIIHYSPQQFSTQALSKRDYVYLSKGGVSPVRSRKSKIPIVS